MKILAFSDIHGNYAALSEMLSKEPIERFDVAVYCGDSVGYYSEGEAVLERLRDIPSLLAVKGNHDDYLLRSISGEVDPYRLADSYGVGYLLDYGNDAIEYLRRLPTKLELNIDGLSIAVVHGTVNDPLEGRLYPDDPLQDTSYLRKYDVVIFGHTHYPMCRKVGKTLLLNPGSLGQPRDGGGLSYCIFDTTSSCVEFKQVSIDKSLLITMLKREPNKSVAEYLMRKIPS